jgi:2-amino-4-hydroxy-6-hydroxymethyldihydropteridine diphosphokinase
VVLTVFYGLLANKQSTEYKAQSTTMIQNGYVGLGSNLGDRAGYLLLAVRGMLDAGLDVIRLSSIYETAPVGNEDQPSFLNMVAELRGSTLPAPDQLLARLLRIEYSLGRTRDVRQGPRTIDLDLLIVKDELKQTEFLTLPHPRLHLRRFVLVPLNELVPNLVHPVLKKPIHEILENTSDKSAVNRWQP